MIYDIAAAIDKGKRDTQEDCVAYGLHEDLSPGFIVLADGMGGHVAGSTASALVVSAIHDELAPILSEGLPDDAEIAPLLKRVTLSANASIATHIAQNADAMGMGTTVIVPILTAGQLHWASVGDSPLYLFRDGDLIRVNEDHSLAPQLDYLVAAGLMDAEVARSHPDRGCLTSALVGFDIPRIDCGRAPVALRAGDIVLASSDGLLFLTDELIREILRVTADRDSTAITDALMRALRELDHPSQDNVSIVVVKVTAAEA